MKRFLLFALAVIMFAACSKDAINEQQNMQTIVDEAPETLVVGFEESDETRIQLNEEVKTVWTNGDQVSVFYRSDANQKWHYQGETGERVAELTRVEAGVATEAMKRVVVVYPYSENYYINTETYNVQATLPAVQNYLKDSYGLNGNIMISSSEYNNFSLKSVCGWLKLQLTGNGEKIKSITLKGNNGEQVAGELYINSADATVTLSSDTGSADDGETGGASGGLVFEDTILKEVTLDCGEGVALGKEATAFYIALPPQTFEKGFTVDITTINGLVMTQSTDKEVVIERNHIQPMTAFTADFHIPETWKIYYTATQKVEPYDKTVFGANIVSNEWDLTTGEGVITFDGKVSSIGSRAFHCCWDLTSITIPDSVTEIGEWAFYSCSSLKKVNICDLSAWCKINFDSSNSNPLIYAKDLYLNGELITELIIPTDVTEIGSYAFYHYTSLISATIPNSVTKIGEHAFMQCSNLTAFYGKFASTDNRCLIIDGVLHSFAPAGITEYTIPDSVTEIGSYVFYKCTSLKSVTIPNSVTSIGSTAFRDCTSLTSVTIGYSVTTIGDRAFADCSSLKGITIPDSVTEIGEWAFYRCECLSNITISNNIKTIGEGTFDYCKSLQSIVIPDSVTEIGNGAFEMCFGLTDITIGNSVEIIGDRAFSECTQVTQITIPDSVSIIGDKAFNCCYRLESITFGRGVTSIRSDAFAECNKLSSIHISDLVAWCNVKGGSNVPYNKLYLNNELVTDLVIPDGVEIMYVSFSGYNLLQSVTIPDSVTEFYNFHVFAECKNLKRVVIGAGMTDLCGWTFSDCTNLEEVYCKAVTPPSGSYFFNGCGSGYKIYVPRASINSYKAATGWKDYANSIVGYDF